MDLFLAVVVRPLIALVVLAFVLLFADWIFRKLPAGRLKRLLFRPLPGHRQRDRWRG
jgi:hypothetical protein